MPLSVWVCHIIAVGAAILRSKNGVSIPLLDLDAVRIRDIDQHSMSQDGKAQSVLLRFVLLTAHAFPKAVATQLVFQVGLHCVGLARVVKTFDDGDAAVYSDLLRVFPDGAVGTHIGKRCWLGVLGDTFVR